MRTWIIAALMLAGFATATLAAEEPTATTTTSEARLADAAELDTHPIISADATWAGNLIIIIGVMFLSAMVVGPVVRSEMVEEPVVVSHDAHDHSGHDHHH